MSPKTADEIKVIHWLLVATLPALVTLTFIDGCPAQDNAMLAEIKGLRADVQKQTEECKP